MSSLCVYCGESNEFNVEHVFSCGLGGHDDLWVLDCVCEECNGKFSKLELELLRKSPIGIARFKLQELGRNRASKTKPPMLQPVRTFHFNDELGYVLEIEAKPKFIGEVVPQLIINPPICQIISELESTERLLIKKLRALFTGDNIQVVEKSSGENKKLFKIETYKLQNDRFKLEESYEAEDAPEDALWLTQPIPADDMIKDGVVWKLHARFFLHKLKTVNYRSESKESLIVDLNSLYHFLNEASEFPAAINRTVINPVVDFSIEYDPEIVRRVISKIGFNFLIKIMGREYVSDVAFDNLKSSVLNGKPDTPHTKVSHGDIFHQFLGDPPEEHHAMYLVPLIKDDGRVSIVFVIQLYGGEPMAVFLSVDAPNPCWSFPVYFLVDYQSHKVTNVDSKEYIRTYCSTITLSPP